MSVVKIDADTLFEEIERLLAVEALELEPSDRVLLIEVSQGNLEVVLLNYTVFKTYTLHARRPVVPLKTSLATLETDLENAIVGRMRLNEQARIAFLLGDLAMQPEVQGAIEDIFSAQCFVIDLFHPDICGMPRMDDLRDYFQRQPATTPYRLELVALQIPEHIEDMPRPHLEVVPLPVFEAGQSACPGDSLGEVRLFAPVINQPIDVYLREMRPHSRAPIHTYHYTIEAVEREFSTIFIFDGTDWQIEWEGAREIEERQQVSHSDIKINTRPRVDIQDVCPKVVIVVESALGMRSLLRNLRDDPQAPGLQETDFAVVKEFVKWLAQTLMISGAQFLVVFYNDVHPEQRCPYEFRGLKDDLIPDSTISTLPDKHAEDKPSFVSAKELIEIIDRDFLLKQTITCDWNKSLEEAAYLLNHLDWGDCDQYAIWIGQSPPHIYAGEDKKAAEQHPGFTTPYDFVEQLKELRAKNVQNIVFFVSADIPTSTLAREARGYWQRIGKPETSFEISLANETDAMPEGKIYDVLEEVSRDLRQVRVIRSIAADWLLNLPFTFIPGNTRIVT